MEIEKQELYDWLSWALRIEITPETLFFEDLGLGEIDIEIFFHEFIDKYQIDASDFNYRNYEPGFIDVWFRGVDPLSFNTEHLYKVVKLGKWVDPGWVVIRR